MANKSKYSFEEVEGKLDIVRNDQGANKVLKGDGTYGTVEVPQDKIQTAVDTYLTENPVSGVTSEDIENAVNSYLEENPVSGLTDDERELLGKIVTTGNGTKFLSDDGTYKTIDVSNRDSEVWDGKTIDLVLFQGQSNMAGMATIPEEPDLVCEYGWQFHHANYKNGVTDSILIPIADGFGSGDCYYDTDYSADVNGGVHNAGLQLSFACRYFELNKVPIVGVSCSYPGMNSNKFIPTSTDVNPNWNVQTNTKMKDAIAYLEAQGYTIRRKYAMYLQGESDGDESFTANKHKSNLRAIFDSFVSNWGCEKVILVRIGNSNDSSNYDKYRTILQAQNELVYENDDILMGSLKASTFRDRGLMSDAWHYTLKGYRELGNDIANTMHYYETYQDQKPLMDKETEVLFPSIRVTIEGIRVKINGVWTTLGAGGGSTQDEVPTGITLNKASVSLAIDGTSQLTPTLEPSTTTAKVGYSSTDDTIATVTSDGLITGIAVGTATITAYFVDYPTIKATCEVTVSEAKANLTDTTEYTGSGTTTDSQSVVAEFKTNTAISSGEKIKMSFNITGTAKIVNEGTEATIQMTSLGALGYSRWYTSDTITADGIDLTRSWTITSTLTASNNIASGTTIAKLTIPANCEYDVAISNVEIVKV